MKRSLYSLFGVLILWLGLMAVCTQKEPVVAMIDNKAISLEEFKEYFSKGKSKEMLKSASLNDLKASLNELVKKEMKIMVSYEMGLDQDSVVKVMSGGILKHHLLQRLFQTEIMAQVITDQDIRDFYAKKANEVVFRTIFLDCPRSAKPEEVESVEAKAADIMKQLRKGADFADMAKQYSGDKESAPNGGMIGALTYQRSDDPVHNLVFATRPGRFAGPVRNARGLNIIKVEEIRERDRKPFNEARVEIEQILRMEKRKDITEKARAYQDKLIQQYEVAYHDTVIALLADTMNALAKSGEDVFGALAKADSEILTSRLATHREGEINVEDFIKRLESDPARGRMSLKTKQDLSMLLSNWLLSDFLLKRAMDKGYLKDKKASKPYYDVLEREMIRVLNQKYFQIKEEPADEVLVEYYKKIKDNKFSLPEKRKVQEIMVKDIGRIKSLAKMIDSGQNFNALAKAHTERRGYDKKQGVLGIITERQWGIIGKTAFSLEVGEISEPIKLDNNRGYSLIRVLSIEPPKIEGFTEARARVKYEYKEMLKKEKEAIWMEEQKNHHHVHIDETVLANAFNEV